mgnify:FL=1
MPKYKGKKLQDIIIDEEIVGHIYGINLNPLNINSEKEIKEYIFNINEVIEDEYTSIYIEEEFPLAIIRKIEEDLSMNKLDGKSIRLFNIPYIIERLMLKMKRDILKEEILIISEIKEETLKIIDDLSNRFNFISVFGLNEMDEEDVYEEVLENAGISIYYPLGNDISLRKYKVIINTVDELLMNFKDIRKNAIIIDFSDSKPFKGSNRYVIEDISIDISDLGLVNCPWISKEISVSLYAYLFKGKYRLFCRVFNNGKLITIEDFINQGIKIKGGF